ncbi:MAG: CDP-diacylglycerol--glycerol-3-phosphate 3-phosphatidyltransferase [Oscillibacter sp.]|nr:CDP-diacylglycerol--glycerol-3-phosphate 3-phosphatidyltransferase [Oscillibacter sp.]
MNLPNKLTLLRIVLIPVFMGVLYWGFPGADYVALAVFIAASLTDLLDGKIARKYNLVTDFGKFADPLADKMLVTAAMLWFVEAGRMPAWALLVVICREFAVSGLRMIASDEGRVIAAGWSGKVKTAATMVCLTLMLLLGPEIAWAASEPLTALPLGWLRWMDPVCVWVIVLTTLYSGVEYFVKNKDVIRSV